MTRIHLPPMNDPSSYPCPIPLSLPDAVTLFAGGAAFAPLRGAYLCFVMIPVEERIGEWRFAGTADSPAAAIATFDAFLKAISLGQGGEDFSARSLLESGVMDLDFKSSWSYSGLPLDEIGEHQVILLAEGGAPYDDAGLAILEVPSLAGSPFASRAPQTERPRTWDQDASPDQEEEDDE